jgi:hypothetical protein
MLHCSTTCSTSGQPAELIECSVTMNARPVGHAVGPVFRAPGMSGSECSSRIPTMEARLSAP